MIVVDSSVWIDYFNGRPSRATDRLDAILGSERVGIGDLILVEVLQGFRRDADAARARELLLGLDVLPMLGVDRALAAAERYRALRRRGVTIRKTADVIIASSCIERGLPLLFSDRDFLPFVEHLGLRDALAL